MMNRMAILIFPILLFLVTAIYGEQKFYADDPVWQEPDTQDASGVKPWEIDLVYDLAENLFSKPGDNTPNVRAQNVNTLEEVPNSSWFTNRIGMEELTAEDVLKGPDTTKGPVPGKWTVIAGKNDGITPGFTIQDSAGIIWFIKPDPPGYLGMATGTEVAVTKLFWALGYNVPETHIASLAEEQLVISEKATVRVHSGRRKMKQSDVDNMLRRAARNEDQTYRVIASKALPGKSLGGFRFYSTRPDDPNDVVPHEHRRELRGYFVFSAWLNHVDCKAINSLDTLVSENGKSHVRHYLLDFSSTLGSGSIYPREYWEGHEYLVEQSGHIGKDVISFGFQVEPYRKIPFYKSTTIGRMPLDNRNWNPERWYARVPNPAFLRARLDDKFWAAQRVMAFTDDMLRAAVRTGQFHDQKSEEFLVRALSERRDAIGRTYYTAINPVINPELSENGILTFGNAAVEAGFAKAPESYQTTWSIFNNATGQSIRLGNVTAAEPRIQGPSGLPQEDGAFIKLEISAKAAEHPSWEAPVRAYFKRANGGWKLIGFERDPK